MLHEVETVATRQCYNTIQVFHKVDIINASKFIAQ